MDSAQGMHEGCIVNEAFTCGTLALVDKNIRMQQLNTHSVLHSEHRFDK